VNTHAQHRGSSLRAKGPQQDASELLSLILDVLSKKKPQKHFFYARKQLTHRSTGNDTLTKNLEKTPVLSLSGLKPNQPTSLQTLLRQTLAEEVFDQKENSTFAKSQTVLQTANSDAPEFLSVQLPRFKFEKGRSQKIQNPITELDQIVSVPFRDQNGQECLAFYQVMSVVHHRGATLNVGHYTASVQDHNGNWTMRNDNSVSNQKQQDALNGQTAYLLRLKKVDEDYIPPISHA